MEIVVRCNEAQRAELESSGLQTDLNAAWVFEKVDLLSHKSVDIILDLLFENTADNRSLLQQASGLKIINSVIHTVAETDPSFIRINGWPTFLKSGIIEASCLHGDLKKLAETFFSCFNKTVAWLPDEPGFVTPRVVSLIINEAYFAMAEGVSTRSEIDTAMKLGTAYPYGPFEWSEKIGLKNVEALLRTLSKTQPRYAPAPLLVQQAALS